MRIAKRKRQSQRFALAPERLKQGRIEHHESKSQYLHNTRGIDVYLPPGYDAENFYCPVLYMHDGNNLFYPELAFGGMPWGVDRVMDHLISLQLIPPMMVVGVYNTLGRNSEYTWRPNGREGGQGPAYARYLIEELKPFIDTQYRTRKTPEFTGVMGSSLGGLISFSLGRYHPQVFGRIGMMSPSFWWRNGEALQEAQQFPKGLNLWLDMGTREGARKGVKVKNNPNIRNVRAMRSVLERRGYRECVDLGYLEDRGGLHNEWWWGQRLHLPLVFLFGHKNAQKRILRRN